jgi:hypothetical protein
LEGTDNKIKTMKRQAYGFRDPEFLRLKILGIHESKYVLYQLRFKLAIHRMFTLRENMLLFAKWKRTFELETV